MFRESQKSLINFMRNPLTNSFAASPYIGPHVGIEFECEGRNLPQNIGNNRSWTIHRDGSLRGESAEYVTKVPVKPKDAPKVIEELFKAFEAEETKLQQSYRTSLHVHYNCGDLNVLQTLNVFFGCLIVEPLLELVAGDNRVNNVFCLTPRENNVMFRHMYSDLGRNRNPLGMFQGDALRYSSFNLCSLYKFCTIENRLMSGDVNQEKMTNWVAAFARACEYFSNPKFIPSDIVELPSKVGITNLFLEIFDDPKLQEFLDIRRFEFNQQQAYKVFEACRQIQSVAYDFADIFSECRRLGPPEKRDQIRSKGPIKKDVGMDIEQAREVLRGRRVEPAWPPMPPPPPEGLVRMEARIQDGGWQVVGVDAPVHVRARDFEFDEQPLDDLDI